MKHLTSTIVSGCLCVAAACPAFGQGEEDPRQQEIEQQIERAVGELFRDLQLQQVEDEPEDPRQQILRDRQRLEELQQRLIRLQADRAKPAALVDLERAAEPVQLDAKAYVDPWADHKREDIVTALDHKDYAVRVSAQASLLADNTLNKDDLKAMVQSAKSPEQRRRLLTVAEHHVLRGMREQDFGVKKNAEGQPVQQGPQPAAVGYSYEPILAHENPHADLPGVQVIATMPGFPGYAHLRRGDIIVQINGLGLSTHHREHDITNWVRWQISSRSAGDTIDFTILRGGEMMAIKMICAEGIALDHMYTTDAFEAAARKQPYKKAWEQVYDELIAQMPAPKTLTPKAAE